MKTGADLTGGLFWHLRAIVARRLLWSAFRKGVEDWLCGWAPPSRSLLLVGPSAGWCLPDRFLTRFDHVRGIDIDPAAASLFRLVHGGALRRAGVSLSWSRDDFFADPAAVLAAHPDAAVLLCNVAGQRCVQMRDPAAVEAEMVALRGLLAGRSWASFHDLLSGNVSAAPGIRHMRRHMDARDLLGSYGLGGAWFDHCTSRLLPHDAARTIIPWRFKRGRLHLIEAGWVQGPAPKGGAEDDLAY